MNSTTPTRNSSQKISNGEPSRETGTSCDVAKVVAPSQEIDEVQVGCRMRSAKRQQFQVVCEEDWGVEEAQVPLLLSESEICLC